MPQPRRISNKEKYNSLYIEFLETRASKVFEDIQNLKAEYEDIQSELKFQRSLNIDQQLQLIHENGTEEYSSDWTWAEKAKYFIKKLGPSTTAQIADSILGKEPTRDRTKVVGSLSAVLTSQAGQKKFKISQNQRGENMFTVI